MKKYKNEYSIDNNVGVLLISKNNEIIAKILIDIEDIDKINKYSWRLNEKGYIVTNINKKKVRLHNLILNRDTSNPKIVCDHINRNKLDNRKSNLRIVSQSENNKNRQMPKGKYYTKRNNKWQAYYIKNKRMHNIGYYNTEEEAKEAVCLYCENQ